MTAKVPARHWSLRRWAAWVATAAILVSLAAIVAGGAAIIRLSDARDKVVGRLDPAATAVLGLSNALVDQESGVRGFALSGREDFLEPYTVGRRDETTEAAALRRALGGRFPSADRDLDAVMSAAQRWHDEYATPTIDAVRAAAAGGVPPAAGPPGDASRGKTLFDAVRTDLDALSTDIGVAQAQGRQQLIRSANLLVGTALGIAFVLLAGAVALTFGLTRGVIVPLGGLTEHVRRVADGEFTHPVEATGPDETRQLGAHVDSMRLRILAELSATRAAHLALDAQARDLARSNAELEQFAYVASHDLQEPLRKVASFCELIEARYNDVLDDRGRQYIAFAVDGAVRMQTLINDLLTFSRVGRTGHEQERLDCGALLDAARADLAPLLERTGAVVEAGPLPEVYGDASLLTSVFSNLIGNAVKFRHPDRPPRVTFNARRDADMWLFSCEDNGIGIDDEYAERIFVLFQRLHTRSAYPGTGIGLAMCRKIIEYHGGRIWLDTGRPADTTGCRFCFTLPATRRVELP